MCITGGPVLRVDSTCCSLKEKEWFDTWSKGLYTMNTPVIHTSYGYFYSLK